MLCFLQEALYVKDDLKLFSIADSYIFSKGSVSALLDEAMNIADPGFYYIPKMSLEAYDCVNILYSRPQDIDSYERYETESIGGLLRDEYKNADECNEILYLYIEGTHGLGNMEAVAICTSTIVIFAVVFCVISFWMVCDDDEKIEDCDDIMIYEDTEADLGNMEDIEDELWESGGEDY